MTSKRKLYLLLILVLMIVILIMIGASIGRYHLTLYQVIQTFLGHGTYRSKMVIFTFRLPRLLLALLVGIGMGISGMIMQNILHNHLASPGTLGVADGSSLFVTIYIAVVAQNFDHPIFLPLLAFVGGIISALIIFLLGTKYKRPISAIKLIMTGIAISACYSAISTFLMYVLDESKLDFLFRWRAGDLGGSNWHYLIILSSWLALFIILLMYQAKTLNIMSLGRDEAISLGVPVKVIFIYLAMISVALSSAVVAFGGNFFFLGLIGPHIAKKIIGVDARYLIPASGLVSAIIILLAVILVDNSSILVNIPTGIVINILSVPYFLYLLMEK